VNTFQDICMGYYPSCVISNHFVFFARFYEFLCKWHNLCVFPCVFWTWIFVMCSYVNVYIHSYQHTYNTRHKYFESTHVDHPPIWGWNPLKAKNNVRNTLVLRWKDQYFMCKYDPIVSCLDTIPPFLNQMWIILEII
jgi:hypothetical protein